MIPQIALKLAVTPENIITAFVVLCVFTGALWLADWLKRRGIE